MKLSNLAYKIHTCGEHLINGQVDFLNGIKLEPEIAYYFKKRKGDQPCYILRNCGESLQYVLNTNYYIGVDWIKVNEYALYVAPKLNSESIVNKDTGSIVRKAIETDYLKMLFDCLRHIEVNKEIDELFEIRWDKPEITISQHQDLLTPLLVIQFLILVKDIVRKGLKKSYYRIEKNLHSKVKGKIIVSETIKQNSLKNKNLDTICSYEEFGTNGLENRLIKKALIFVQRYLPLYQHFATQAYLNDLFNFILPAFDEVSDKVEISEIHYGKVNLFYKEYTDAIRLSKLILKRYGYNIKNVDQLNISTPPFWIDMSKLFEIYVLGLLKDRFHKQVQYHFAHFGNELDFVLKADYKMVIDAKYKPLYSHWHNDEDVRQVSGYARLEKVYKFLEMEYPESIDCLIIYPDQENGFRNLLDVNLTSNKIPIYNGVYKIGIKLPEVNEMLQ